MRPVTRISRHFTHTWWLKFAATLLRGCVAEQCLVSPVFFSHSLEPHTMAVVVVAGGLGDLGRLIVEALVESGKHEVYVMSRNV
jgi:hypothetical protein